MATLTLTGPRSEMRSAPPDRPLTALFGALRTDDTRVAVLTGAGSRFCAGADIDWMRSSA